MLELTLIFSTALLVGLSGAVMPGPLTAVTVEYALRRGYRAAPLATLGHALLEAIMVILLLVGLGNYHNPAPVAGDRIGRRAGAFAWMGYGAQSAACTLTPAAAPGRAGGALPSGAALSPQFPTVLVWGHHAPAMRPSPERPDRSVFLLQQAYPADFL